MPSSPPHWAGLSGLLGELLEELLGWRDTEKAQPLPASALHPAQSWDPPPPLLLVPSQDLLGVRVISVSLTSGSGALFELGIILGV